jgi:hypothetical protein
VRRVVEDRGRNDDDERHTHDRANDGDQRPVEAAG